MSLCGRRIVSGTEVYRSNIQISNNLCSYIDEVINRGNLEAVFNIVYV